VCRASFLNCCVCIVFAAVEGLARDTIPVIADSVAALEQRTKSEWSVKVFQLLRLLSRLLHLFAYLLTMFGVLRWVFDFIAYCSRWNWLQLCSFLTDMTTIKCHAYFDDFKGFAYHVPGALSIATLLNAWAYFYFIA